MSWSIFSVEAPQRSRLIVFVRSRLFERAVSQGKGSLVVTGNRVDDVIVYLWVGDGGILCAGKAWVTSRKNRKISSSFLQSD